MAKKKDGSTPTVHEIITLRKERQTFYSAKVAQQKKDDLFFELDYDAGIPTDLGFEQRTPSTARDWVETGVNNYTLDNPRAIVPLRSKSDASREKDAKIEEFLNYWLQLVVIPIKQSSIKLLLRGEAFLKISIDDTYIGSYEGKPITDLSESEIKEFEEKRLYHFPLKLTIPDPINVFPSPAHNGLNPVDVIEHYDITVAEALNMCKLNGWVWSTTKKSTQNVSWTSYISADYRCFLLDDKPVLTPEVQTNWFGFCPYVHPAGGFGNTSYEGKPEVYYKGVLFKRRDIIKMESRVLSQLDAINSRFAWGIIKVWGEDVDVEELYPGGVTTINPKYPIRENERVKVEIHKGESPPQGLYEMLATIRSMAQPPIVLSGQGLPGVYSGVQEDSRASRAKKDYKDAFKNHEDALAVLLGMGLRIIDKVYAHPVAIGGMSMKASNVLKPSDIDGHYDCKVELLADSPEAMDMAKATGANLFKSGVISDRTNLRDYHRMSLKEVNDEQSQKLAEKMLMQPGVLEFAARDAMKRLGMKQAEEEVDEAQGKLAANTPPKREPETISTGLESIPKRGRTGEEVPSVSELGGA